VVAVFLGWLVLHERIDRYILMGSAIIVASVVMVTSAKIHGRVAEDGACCGRTSRRLTVGRIIRVLAFVFNGMRQVCTQETVPLPPTILSQSIDSRELNRKVFKNKDLGCQRVKEL
jgi:hypothetical protein